MHLSIISFSSLYPALLLHTIRPVPDSLLHQCLLASNFARFHSLQPLLSLFLASCNFASFLHLTGQPTSLTLCSPPSSRSLPAPKVLSSSPAPWKILVASKSRVLGSKWQEPWISTWIKSRVSRGLLCDVGWGRNTEGHWSGGRVSLYIWNWFSFLSLLSLLIIILCPVDIFMKPCLLIYDTQTSY